MDEVKEIHRFTFKDESTVFSIAPFEVYDMKPGILPGNYRIPKCTDAKYPSRLVVSKGIHIMYVGGRKTPIKIDTPSFQIAKAIVDDCISSQMWCTPGVENPGLIWFQGDVSEEDFLIKNKNFYDDLIERQRRWFLRICKETDNEWGRYKNHRVVSDTARFASRALGLDPEWMASDEVYGFNKCPACSTMNDKSNVICSNCKLIFDSEAYKKLTFAGGVK